MTAALVLLHSIHRINWFRQVLMMSLDNTLWLAYVLTEVALVGLLLYRRVWHLLPLFCVYCVWDVLSNVGNYASGHFFGLNSTSYLLSYLVDTVIDSILQFCVLVELAWSVLRPARTFLPRFTLPAVAGIILLLGAAVWLIPIPAGPIFGQLKLLMHLAQCVSILRILFFLILAGFSQLLSIGWRDRELQVATGLGFYSLVSLAAAILSTHAELVHEYKNLNQFVIASFLCALFYWVFSFAQKEAARRDFTPQMQNLLLAVAGVARAERTALTESAKSAQHPLKNQ